MPDKTDNTPAEETTQGSVPADAQNDAPPAADNQQEQDASQGQGEIHDPARYYQSQAEKFQRLLDKAEAEKQQLEERLAATGKQVEDSVNSDLQSLRDELQGELEQARQARISAQRAQAANEAGLPSELTALITGEDDDTIAQQVELLKQHIGGKKASRVQGEAKTGAPSSSESTLTLAQIQSMSSEEYRRRREEVLDFLRSQRK